jgi:hypothetical protein
MQISLYACCGRASLLLNGAAASPQRASAVTAAHDYAMKDINVADWGSKRFFPSNRSEEVNR